MLVPTAARCDKAGVGENSVDVDCIKLANVAPEPLGKLARVLPCFAPLPPEYDCWDAIVYRRFAKYYIQVFRSIGIGCCDHNLHAGVKELARHAKHCAAWSAITRRDRWDYVQHSDHE